MEKLDKYFKDRLHDMEIQPSARVWDEIEARVESGSQGRKGFIWIAASLTIMFSIGSYLWLERTGDLDPINLPVKDIVNVQPENTIPTLKPMITIEEGSTVVPQLGISGSGKTKNGISIQSKPQELIADNSSLKGRKEGIEEYHQKNTSEITQPVLAQNDAPNEEKDMKMKVSVNNPMKYLKPLDEDGSNTIASVEPQKEGFGKRLGEYANSQLNNIVEGKPLEKPKKHGLDWPEIQIPLGQIFSVKSTEN